MAILLKSHLRGCLPGWLQKPSEERNLTRQATFGGRVSKERIKTLYHNTNDIDNNLTPSLSHNVTHSQLAEGWTLEYDYVSNQGAKKSMLSQPPRDNYIYVCVSYILYRPAL